MKNDPEIYKKGIATQFSSTNQPKNSGRKKNFFTYLKEEYDLSQSDLTNCINHISQMPMVKVLELIDKVKNKEKVSEILEMPLIYYKIFEGMAKGKTQDILTYMKMSGKAADKIGLDDDTKDLFGAFLKNLGEE